MAKPFVCPKCGAPLVVVYQEKNFVYEVYAIGLEGSSDEIESAHHEGIIECEYLLSCEKHCNLRKYSQGSDFDFNTTDGVFQWIEDEEEAETPA